LDIKKVNRRCAKNKVQLEAQQSRPILSQNTGKGEFNGLFPSQNSTTAYHHHFKGDLPPGELVQQFTIEFSERFSEMQNRGLETFCVVPERRAVAIPGHINPLAIKLDSFSSASKLKRFGCSASGKYQSGCTLVVFFWNRISCR